MIERPAWLMYMQIRKAIEDYGFIFDRSFFKDNDVFAEDWKSLQRVIELKKFNFCDHQKPCAKCDLEQVKKSMKRSLIGAY